MSLLAPEARYRAFETLTFRQWPGEDCAVVRRSDSGSTHLLAAEAMGVLEVSRGPGRGVTLREIAHALGLGEESDAEVDACLLGIIESLVQSGLLGRADGDPDPEPEVHR